jgi:hypothetical protein
MGTYWKTGRMLTALLGLCVAGGSLLEARSAAALGNPRNERNQRNERNDDEETHRKRDYLGTYHGTRTGPNGRQTVLLVLERQEARLETTTRSAVRKYRGQWQVRDGRAVITLIGVTQGNSFSFRREGSQLLGTRWDQRVWGADGWDLREGDNTLDTSDVMGTWSHRRTGGGPQQNLELDLQRDGVAVLRQEYPGRGRPDVVSRGTWTRRQGRVEVNFRRDNDDDDWVFRPNGDMLEAVTWNRETWGADPPRFTRSTETAQGLPGTYYDRQTAGAGGRVMQLDLERSGTARLTVNQANRRPTAVAQVMTGTWRRQGDGRVDVDVADRGVRQRFVLRDADDTLTATTWDRAKWGSQAPTFRRDDRFGDESPGRLQGRYLSRRSVSGGFQSLNLALDPGGRAQLTVTEPGRAEVVYAGTWQHRDRGRLNADDDRMEVQVSRGGTRFDFVFRVDDETLVATEWDRSEWGPRAPTFDRIRR